MDQADAPYRSVWGSLYVSDPISAHRSGVTRYRLEVFPPGTNSFERRALRRFRRFRVWAAIVAILLCLVIGSGWPGWTGPLSVGSVYLVTLGVGLHRTGRLRRETRRLTAALVRIGGSAPLVEGDFSLLERCAIELESLDRHRLDGELTPLGYEAEWGRLYQQLEPTAA